MANIDLSQFNKIEIDLKNNRLVLYSTSKVLHNGLADQISSTYDENGAIDVKCMRDYILNVAMKDGYLIYVSEHSGYGFYAEYQFDKENKSYGTLEIEDRKDGQ